ncbi:MAG TPA: LemA family protein [Nitriliruptorales bacterium]
MWWALGGGVLLLGIVLIATYNRLVGRRNKVQEAWSGIDVQLQRRADLVPMLVDTVRGYQVHERDLLLEVTEARAAVVAAQGPRASGQADDALEASLGRLFAVAESYPDLKASENFLALQRELSELEEQISFARRYFNALVQELNTDIQRFPTVLVAGPLGFRPAEYFKAGPDAADAPTLGLGS